MATKPVQTITITNFGGRLTRIINGELNSGFAKFNTSFGYDPFSKPMNLTWLNQPSSVVGMTPMTLGNAPGPVIAGVNKAGDTQSITPTTFLVTGNAGFSKVFSVNARNDSVFGVSSIVGDSFAWGGSAALYGQSERLYFTSDLSVRVIGSVTSLNVLSIDGLSSSVITGGVGASSTIGLVKNTNHPLRLFAGRLIFGNGPSIGVIDTTGTVISSIFTVNNQVGNQFSQLSPPLPSTQWVWDVEPSVDGNYLYISASTILPEFLLNFQNQGLGPIFESASGTVGEGAIYGWNGVDQGITTRTGIPSGVATALQTYLNDQRFFIKDFLGSAVSDGVRKNVSLPRNKPVLPNATDTNGNFLTWACPETTEDGSRVASLYYYGALDDENPTGVYRLMRWQTNLTDGAVYQVPYQSLVMNAYTGVNQSVTGINQSSVTSYGKHYISAYSISSLVQSTSSVATQTLLSFNVTSANDVPPQSGVYETQTQLFSKKVSLVQIRVYTEPTVTGNGFQLDVIGSGGEVIDNGTFTYTFSAGSDITLLQGALERINFDPGISPGYGFGIRITNTGTTNMTIKKVEIDYTQEGK